ncbi:MAG: PilT/PilU family type 4a pilus ATPase [Candidatus Omnitrophica bacterium]|nr:PilT/PilU family type 4a pilus ATPase [Candidatus Omnitrophota bacterium]MBU1996958.1 PilT/PilU family type 4a pilus ATPase [Candidatus Omnitrophota bacterium]
MEIRKILKSMVESEASDLYLRLSASPHMRVDGKVTKMDFQELTGDDMTIISNYLLENDARKREFIEKQDIDFIHVDADHGRFRINMFMQRGTTAIVARYVHSKIKTFKELHLPEELCKMFCEEASGLFLVCGPAGNGKSTTIASMLEYINNNQSKHVITIEDPVEYLFEDKKCLISQRELGIDVPSYTSALKHVTQQSPDIMFIGNIRDESTMKAAITATELGTFVMTTFHTVNAVQTIIRIVNFFPPYLHDEVRMQLSMILRGVVSIRLLPRIDGQGRVPAFETMVVTPTIARLIREGKTREVQAYIDEGEVFGMKSFKRSLLDLVKAGIVDENDARIYADSKTDFDLGIKGVQ